MLSANESQNGEQKIAFITGVTGQDGSYLAEFLLQKGYVVHGLIRRENDAQVVENKLGCGDAVSDKRLFFHVGDFEDPNLIEILQRIFTTIRPTEVYNLAAFSDPSKSFDEPEVSTIVNGVAPLRILEAIRRSGLSIRFFQAGSSELFGFGNKETPQSEKTPFSPQSPYAVSKLSAYYHVLNYRQKYGFHASNGILFNHESPRRGEKFSHTKGVSRCGAYCEWVANTCRTWKFRRNARLEPCLRFHKGNVAYSTTKYSK